MYKHNSLFSQQNHEFEKFSRVAKNNINGKVIWFTDFSIFIPISFSEIYGSALSASFWWMANSSVVCTFLLPALVTHYYATYFNLPNKDLCKIIIFRTRGWCNLIGVKIQKKKNMIIIDSFHFCNCSTSW